MSVPLIGIYCHCLADGSHIADLSILTSQLPHIYSQETLLVWHLYQEQDTNMNGLLLLFYCLEILAALLCGADGKEQNETPLSTTQISTSASSPPDFTTAANGTSEASSLTSTETFTTVSLLSSSRSPAATSVRPLKTTTSTTVAPNWGIYRRECLAPYLVSGILIIVCTVLLVSNLMLTCKVRHLSSRLKALSGDNDLISNSEFWMGTARKNKSRSGPEAKETSVLMTDFGQTPEVLGDGANKEEGKKVSVDGQMGEENKKKVEDNGDESKKETPVTKKSLSSKPQEESTDPKSSKAEATSEEPKGEV
ncbi:uncharacterized protein LOC117774780 [Hippoglossus hippoglossus]|uniref:uncharacterized protein LOC117774780 n=1 Tax=Hippoglossus hippoglossus TaxID=8267 RepID=UPI00148E53E4|nr:uncharacterized protein LOC117774780 [Hippoglossus hippoglossus]